MGKCASCGKKGFFLKLSSSKLCSDCANLEYEQAKQNRENAKTTYNLLATEYSKIEPFRRCIDNGDLAGIQVCLDACSQFENLVQNVTITPVLSEVFLEKAVRHSNYYELPEFNASTAFNDDLTDISKTLSHLASVAQYRKNLLLQSYANLVEFSQILETLPRYEMILSEVPAKKRTVAEASAIPFSNITKRTSREKLGNFVVIDVETTGLSASSAEIIEISAIRFRGFKPTECFSTLCSPKNGINEEAAKVNKITAEMVKDKPIFSLIAQSLQEFIADDNLVGHNLPFDLSFIIKHGVDLSGSKRKYYDTLSIAQHTLKKAKRKWDRELWDYTINYDIDYDVEDYKLKTLCNYYEIPFSGAHRALADCYATGLLLERLAKSRE